MTAAQAYLNFYKIKNTYHIILTGLASCLILSETCERGNHLNIINHLNLSETQTFDLVEVVMYRCITLRLFCWSVSLK